MKNLWLLSLVLFAGCTSTKLSDADRAAIHTVTISQKVEMPSRITYYGPGQIIGSGFGIIGAAISLSTSFSTADKLEAALTTNDISVPAILTSAFERELTSSNLFPVTHDPAEADATFYFNVKQYGIFGGITEPLHGMLWVEASLTNRAGKLIWRNSTQSHGDKKKIPDLDFNQLKDNRDNLWQTFDNPSTSASQELIKTLTPRKKK